MLLIKYFRVTAWKGRKGFHMIFCLHAESNESPSARRCQKEQRNSKKAINVKIRTLQILKKHSISPCFMRHRLAATTWTLKFNQLTSEHYNCPRHEANGLQTFGGICAYRLFKLWTAEFSSLLSPKAITKKRNRVVLCLSFEWLEDSFFIQFHVPHAKPYIESSTSKINTSDTASVTFNFQDSSFSIFPTFHFNHFLFLTVFFYAWASFEEMKCGCGCV